jgi:hypothetical protein
MDVRRTPQLMSNYGPTNDDYRCTPVSVPFSQHSHEGETKSILHRAAAVGLVVAIIANATVWARTAKAEEAGARACFTDGKRCYCMPANHFPYCIGVSCEEIFPAACGGGNEE